MNAKPATPDDGDRPQRPVSELGYSDASRELDEIVAFFEQRDVDVDQLVAQLERATAIVDELDRRLRRTRLQVEELVPRLAAMAKRTGATSGGREDAEAELATQGVDSPFVHEAISADDRAGQQTDDEISEVAIEMETAGGLDDETWDGTTEESDDDSEDQAGGSLF